MNKKFVTKEEAEAQKLQRDAQRKAELARPISAIREHTAHTLKSMDERDRKAYDRLVRYAFRKRSDRTLFIAIEPNRAAQIQLKADERADGDSYAVADALDILAAAVVSGRATVFMQHKELNELSIGILTGVVVQKNGNLRVVDPKNLQTAWRSYVSCETFCYDGNLKCRAALVS